MEKKEPINFGSFQSCAGHGTNLTGESPVTGSLPPSVANHKPKAVMLG